MKVKLNANLTKKLTKLAKGKKRVGILLALLAGDAIAQAADDCVYREEIRTAIAEAK